MKRYNHITVLAVAASVVLSSCLRTEEPQGIENIRNAKAELIKAQAQYKVAEIALVEADVQMKNTTAEGMDLDNRLKELENQAAELELQKKESDIEHQKKLWELEEALAVEDNSYEIAKIQKQIMQLELDKVKLELDKLEIEQDKELAVEKHKEALVKAQQKVDEAEAAYQLALREIAAAAQGLTEEEQAQIDAMKTRIETLRTQINQAELDLIDAQKNYIDAKYNYDVEALRYTYQSEIILKEREVSGAEDLLAEAKSLDLNGNADGWLAQKAAIEEQIAESEEEVASLELSMAEKYLELEAPETELRNIDARREEIGEQIDVLFEEAYELYYGYPKDEMTLSLELPDALARDAVFTTDFYNTVFKPYVQDPSNLEGAVVTGFSKVNNGYGEQYLLSGNTVEWVAVRSVHENIVGAYDSFLSDIIRPGVSVDNLKEELEMAKFRFESSYGEKTLYENNLKMYREGKAEYERLAAEYGIRYGKYVEGNLLEKAEAAVKNLQDVTNPGSSDLETWIGAVRKEQEVRHELSGYSVAGWEKFTVENYKLPSDDPNRIDVFDLSAAVENSLNNSIEDYAYNHSYDADPEKWSAAQKWNEAAMELYNIGFCSREIDETLFEGSLVFVYDDSYSYSPLYNEVLEKILIELGYGYSGYSVDAQGRKILDNYMFTSSLWLRKITVEKSLVLMQSVIDNDSQFRTLKQNMSGLYDKLADEETWNRIAEIESEIKSLSKQSEELIPQIEAQESIITGIMAEADAIEVEIAAANVHIGRLGEIVNMLDALIDNEDVVIDGAVYRPGEEGLEEAYAEWIVELEDEVAQAKENLRQAQTDLERLENDEDPAKYVYDKAEKQYRQAEEKHQALVEEFNLYNDMLDELLNQIIG